MAIDLPCTPSCRSRQFEPGRTRYPRYDPCKVFTALISKLLEMGSVNSDKDAYSAPGILHAAQYIVDFPRRDYSTDFAAFVAGDEDAREAYLSGLLVLGCILASICIIWWMVLIVLKCKGKTVGCAAGRSFRGERVGPREHGNSAGSTDVEDEWISGAEPSRESSGHLDDTSFQSSIKSSEFEQSIVSEDTASQLDVVSKPTTRERRTQVAFFTFGILTIVAVPFLLTFSFSPLKEAVDSAENYLMESTTILSQVQNALNAISSSVDSSAEMIPSVLPTAKALCPLQAMEQIKQSYGIDLEYIVALINYEYDVIRATIDLKLADVVSDTNNVDNILEKMEKAQYESKSYLWAVPGLLLALSSITASLLFGVILAWKRQSNRQAQQILSYGVLPCLVALSFACWSIGIFSALGVALFNDACTQGQKGGSPDVTIKAIVDLEGFGENTTTYKLVTGFTTGCLADNNPTASIEELEDDVQHFIDNIWDYLTRIDSVGRTELTAICGSDALNAVLSDAQDMAKLLTSARRAIAMVSNSLQCEEISPIYYGVVEETICSHLATSVSWSMFIFLFLGVSTTCMISLRASWRHRVGEEQIYNEDEEAENMFLDEHEEYLHYISKYKQEWEEYGGIHSVTPVTPGPPRSIHDNSSQSEESTGSRTEFGVDPVCLEEDLTDDDVKNDHMKHIGDYAKQQEVFNPYLSGVPASPSTDVSEDISFLSLRTFRISTPKTNNNDSDKECITKKEVKGTDDGLLGVFGNATAKDPPSLILEQIPSDTAAPRSQSELARSLSDIVLDDSSLVSRPRSTKSEGRGFFNNGWRGRSNTTKLQANADTSIDTLGSSAAASIYVPKRTPSELFKTLV